MRPLLRTALAVAALALVPAAAASGATGGAGTSGGVPPSDVVDPRIELSLPRTAAGAGPTDLEVRGRLYGYGQVVTILLDGEVVADGVKVPQGEFDRTIRLDPLPACGRHEVEARGQGGKLEPPRDTAVFVVTCPTLSIDPTVVDSNDLPRETVWQIEGFNPGTAVALRLGAEPVEVVKTDDDGVGRLRTPLGPLPCGTVTATAAEARPAPPLSFVPPARSLPSATTTFTVRCPTPEPEPVPAVLQLNPVVVATGTTTRVTGASFPAGEATVAWVFADGTTVPAGTVTVPASGGFVTDLLVLANSPQGPRELVVGTAVAAASAQALVVAGTTQPGRNGLVNRR